MAIVATNAAQFAASGLGAEGCELRDTVRIMVAEGASFHCGENTIFDSISISVKPGGRFSIGSWCIVKGVMVAEENSDIIIGDRLICNMSVDIRAAEGKAIYIGHNCLFANPRVYNSDFHGIYNMQDGTRINPARDIRIGDHVWLGMNSLVLKGSEIGNGSIAGAGAVVSGVQPPYSILAGNPAVVKKRNVTWTNRIFPQIAVKPKPPLPGPAAADLPEPAVAALPDLVPRDVPPAMSETSIVMTSDPVISAASSAASSASAPSPAAAPTVPPQDARQQLMDRITAMRRDARALMEDCVSFGRGDPQKFIDMGIPQSQLFMAELLPFIHNAYMAAPTNAEKTVLDIGPQSFGGTKLLYDIHNAGTHNKLKLQITAVDIVNNFEMLQKLMIPEVEFLIQDIFSIQDRQWDFVICSHVIEHVPDPLPFLARCQALARDFVLVACPWKEFPITTKGHVNTIDNALVKAAGGQDLTIYRNYMWGKKREVCIFKLPGKALR